jgi:tRNA(fMet)-specific endonuclease VapC
VTLRFLLDTSTLSAAVSRGPDPKVVDRLARDGAACAIAAPVWHELLYGVDRLPAGSKRARLEDFVHRSVERSFPILPYDHVAATWHARERARLERAGKVPPFVDGQIAAIAYSNDLELVTSNAKDFAAWRGLRVVDWRR